jgi:hypothetical protein
MLALNSRAIALRETSFSGELRSLAELFRPLQVFAPGNNGGCHGQRNIIVADWRPYPHHHPSRAFLALTKKSASSSHPERTAQFGVGLSANRKGD